MTNKVEIQTRNIELSEKIRSYVNKKANRLDHYLPSIDEAHVNFSYQKSARNIVDRNAVEITVRAKGIILRTEERADDPLAAFDAALDNMQRQIERYKGKHFLNKRGAARASGDGTEEEYAEESDELPELIARRKTFRLFPMNPAEAIEQMRLLGHESFFIFFNVETGKINVLYQRRDGSYGLIEVEMA